MTPESASRPGRADRVTLAVGGLAVLLWAVGASLFTVDVTEYGVLMRFGAVVRVVREPGLHFKAPFDTVVRLDRRMTFSQPPPAEYLTVDKKNIVVESLATWRIADPERYLAALATRGAAESRLADLVVGEIGAVLGRYQAAALVAPDGDPQRFQSIVTQIRDRVARFASEQYGIDVADLALLRLGLPDQNREHVVERMKAERGRIAKELRTAGELQARKIIAQADRERGRIEAQAYEQAQRLRAEGDAEASRTYAAAYSQDPAFYRFRRTLQAYQKFLDEQTTLFLPADAEVMRVLRPGARPLSGSHPAAASTAAKPRLAPRAVSVAGGARSPAGSAPALPEGPEEKPR